MRGGVAGVYPSILDILHSRVDYRSSPASATLPYVDDAIQWTDTYDSSMAHDDDDDLESASLIPFINICT